MYFKICTLLRYADFSLNYFNGVFSMKKLIAVLLSLLLVLSLSGCTAFFKEKKGEKEDETDTSLNSSYDNSSKQDKTDNSSSSNQNKAKAVDASIQENLNLFLSNFSEQNFCGYNTNHFNVSSSNKMELIKFAMLFHEFNGYEMKGFALGDEYYFSVPFNMINLHLDRFFGVTLSDSQITRAVENDYFYKAHDNMVGYPAAAGATLTRMSVGETITDLGNGTFRVSFSVYQATVAAFDDDIITVGGIIHDKSVYTYNAEQVRKSPHFDYERSGWAIVRPHVYKGENTYQLIEYHLD